MGSDVSYGNNGLFQLKNPQCLTYTPSNLVNVIASDGEDWEHVSVTIGPATRTPTWEEMNHVKNLFWEEEDLVVQLHPPISQYINHHSYCLHLWRKAGTNDFCEMPPKDMV